MRIIDITRTVNNDTPVWPGDPEVKLEWLSRISEGGAVNLTALHMCAHAGTHLDMPSHFIDQGKNLDDLDLGTLIGIARVVQVPGNVRIIDETYLRSIPLEGVERILFKTMDGNTVKVDPLTFHEDFVALDASGARFLAGTSCKLVGIDAMSVAIFDDPDGGHLPLLEAGILLLEGLKLDEVAPGEYQLIALPMKLAGREGAPVRAILLDL